MLNPLIIATLPTQRIWTSKPRNVSETIRRHRNVVAKKLGNSNLNRITLKTFRHWKATTEYHKTKDLLYVKELLGHKSIQNTLIYTHLVDFEDNDQFIVKVAKTLDEYTELLEPGYNYISDFDDMKVLRKRK
jgi:integrase